MAEQKKQSTKGKASKSKPKQNLTKADLRTEKEIAMDFAIKVHEKFDRIVKASVLFGSQSKNNAGPNSDIDIIIIIDDASINWDLELISWYREELGKIVADSKYSYELHINTIKLTVWWKDLLYGDPVVLNILRYGQALIDSGGFFNPIKALLAKGLIHSTPEAVYAALQRAPDHLLRSKSAEMGAIEGVYWTMIDSAQAALMMAGQLPPSPEHIPQMLNETFVSKGVLKSNYVKAVKDIYSLHKAISHNQISNVKGAEIDSWQKIAEDFMYQMTKIVDDIIEAKKS